MPRTSSVLRGPLLSAISKLCAAPVVAGCWLLAARVVVREVDSEGYAAYMLVAGLAALLPFADLGLGTAVMDAFARRGSSSPEHPRQVLTTTWRLLIMSAAALFVLAILLGASGLWSTLLGLPQTRAVNISVSACLIVLAAGLPFSVGPRILTGLGLNHWAVGFQTLSAMIMVLLILGLAEIGAGVETLAIAPYLGVLISNGIALAVGLNAAQVRRPRMFGDVLGAHRLPRVQVAHIAGPMLVITCVLPLAFQLDRIILSHFGTQGDVASYSLTYQVYSPMLGVLGSAGVALWPFFARSRSERYGLEFRNVAAAEIAFLSVSLAMALVIVFATPVVAVFVAESAIQVPWGLRLGLAALLLTQAASYPLAMILTDPVELRIQAVLHILMLVVNLPLSISMTQPFGAAGPVWASVASVAVFLLLPQTFRVRRLLGQHDRRRC